MSARYQPPRLCRGMARGNVMGTAIIITAMYVVFWLYFLPTSTALRNRNRNVAAILVLNVFLGWTFLGWVGALVWAFIKTDNSELETVLQALEDEKAGTTEARAKLTSLQSLRDRNQISENEYLAQRNKILASSPPLPAKRRVKEPWPYNWLDGGIDWTNDQFGRIFNLFKRQEG